MSLVYSRQFNKREFMIKAYQDKFMLSLSWETVWQERKHSALIMINEFLNGQLHFRQTHES